MKQTQLTTGIATEGASPQIAVKLKEDIQKMIPNQIEKIVDSLSEIRIIAKQKIKDVKVRMQVLKEETNRCYKYRWPLSQEEIEELVGVHKKDSSK